MNKCSDGPQIEPSDPNNKRAHFEEIMRKYFPPEQFPHLWNKK